MPNFNLKSSLQASDTILRAEQASAIRAMGPFGKALVGPVSKLHYQCERCRDDAPAAEESDGDSPPDTDTIGTRVTMTGGSASSESKEDVKLEGHHMTTRWQAQAANIKGGGDESTSAS